MVSHPGKAQMKDDVILSSWGRSFRADNKPLQPHQALSVQIHCLVKSSEPSAVLAGSGFNHLFATPKDEQGRPDAGYRILWFTADWAYANSLAGRLVNHLGLVKGKHKLGLRFTLDTFEEAWKIANPSAPLPSAVSSNHVYKIDALPFVTQEALVKWAQNPPRGRFDHSKRLDLGHGYLELKLSQKAFSHSMALRCWCD